VHQIDEFMIELDLTENKGNLGANAVLGVSMAVWRAAAGAKVCPVIRFVGVGGLVGLCDGSVGMAVILLTGGKGVPLYQFFHKYSGSKEPYVMPVPFFNVLNGGVHSGNTIAFQDFMIAPVGAKSMAEAVRMGAEVYQELKKIVAEKYGPAGNVHFPSYIMYSVLFH